MKAGWTCRIFRSWRFSMQDHCITWHLRFSTTYLQIEWDTLINIQSVQNQITYLHRLSRKSASRCNAGLYTALLASPSEFDLLELKPCILSAEENAGTPSLWVSLLPLATSTAPQRLKEQSKHNLFRICFELISCQEKVHSVEKVTIVCYKFLSLSVVSYCCICCNLSIGANAWIPREFRKEPNNIFSTFNPVLLHWLFYGGVCAQLFPWNNWANTWTS